MSDASGHNPAKELLEEGMSLHDLEEAAQGCTACELYRDATHVVFGDRGSKAKIMLLDVRRRIRRELTGNLRTAPEIAGDDG